MTFPNIVCPRPVHRANSQGLDAIEVGPDQRTLNVTFIADVASYAYLYEPGRYSLSGGRRLHPKILLVTSGAGPKQLILHLDRSGDFSIYTLIVEGPTIDPFFASKRFSFKIECDDPFDCRPQAVMPHEELPSTDIDYLAKDYVSFRRLLIDLISARMPEWAERSEADLGIVLTELFAEAADRLSYFQDRVANEAYLTTATQRRSVQLHSALIGYRMHPGVAAATYLFFEANETALIAAGTPVRTRTQGDELSVIFETGPGDVVIYPTHNMIEPYNWDHASCCLPAGATEITVIGDLSQFRVGDALLIADQSNPDQREIVILSDEPQILPEDPIKAHPAERLTVLRWEETQALQFEYCLENSQTIVRGNLIPATHGETVEPHDEGVGDENQKWLRIELSRAPLTYIAPHPGAPPEEAVSTLRVTVEKSLWEERESLIESDSFDQHYRIEIDEDGYATIVFGDGLRGQKPPTGSEIEIAYRIGIGPAGNVGRDTLVLLGKTNEDRKDERIASVTNPLPAHGGIATEGKDEVRRVAPLIIRTPIRCVTEADYERAATEYRENGVARVQRAKARFIWTGSWHTVFINVDPIGVETLSDSLRASLYAYLEERKLAGYDLEISATHYVPLDIGLQVCVCHEYFAADVKATLLRALSSRVNPDGSRGFFHPDNYSFGDQVYLSHIYAAIEAVPGVDSVVVTRFCRLHQRDPEAATTENQNRGYLAVDEMEIIRLDNDPSFPENGRLILDLLGGK